MQAGSRTLHPLVATAAIAVIVVSLLGAITLIHNQVSAQKAEVSASAENPALPAAVAQNEVPAAAPAAPVQAPAAAVTAAKPHPAKPPRHVETSDTAPPSAATAGSAVPPPPAGTPPAPPPDVVAAVPPPVCADCGVVSAVRTVKVEGSGTGLGAVAGGVAGAVVGNQIGRGNGREVARVLGILGGAVAGHQIEKQARSTTQYEVDVRMDHGEVRTVTLPGDPGLIVGQRVHVVGSQITVDPALAPHS